MARYASTACKAAVLALASVSFNLPALAHDPEEVERGFIEGLINDGESKECENPRILKKIVKKFRHQVKNVPHLPDVEIVEFKKVHQHRYQEERALRPIARRYCMATALLSDGRKRSVWYVVENGMGFASIGDGVQFCVSGFDRWNVYDGSCRVLR